jgi:hypothetical protein
VGPSVRIDALTSITSDSPLGLAGSRWSAMCSNSRVRFHNFQNRRAPSELCRLGNVQEQTQTRTETVLKLAALEQ